MQVNQQTEKRVLTIVDLQQIVLIGAPAFSADDTYIAYVSTATFVEENTQKEFICVAKKDTGDVVKKWEGSSPLWSPAANEIAYLAPYNDETFIWIYSVESNAHKPLVPVYESHYFMGHLSIKNFAWSPQGTRIAYVSADRDGLIDKQQNDVQVIDRLLYKTKGGRGRTKITDDALTHIWIANVADGTTQLVTPGVYNEHSICWSPDGKCIAFISNRTADFDNNQLHDLWSIDIETKKTVRHTEAFGTAYQPCWSPDGSCIAFLGTRSLVSTNDSPAEDTHLYIVAADGSEARCLTKTLDRRIEQPAWHPQKPVLFFTAGSKGTTSIYTVSVATGDIDLITGNNTHILEYNVNKTGNDLVFTNTDSTHPAEVFIHNISANTTTQFTQANSSFLQQIQLQPAEDFWFKSFDATNVQGWLIKPAGFIPGNKYPLVLVIHGGPHNMFGYEFEDRMQLLSAKGYGVLFINPRGSSGYGQIFSSGCVLNWGGGDYKDLMAGVDAAIARNTWIDADRLGVTGQSYGGYMTNWILTQTHRFKAAVADGSISNLVSFAGTSLYHSLMESEFEGSAYDNVELLWQCSPLKYIKNAKTPLLLLHGETDNEVPLTQAEEMYIALKKLGIKSRLVVYTGEGHGWRPDLKPLNRYDVLSRTIDWLDRFLKNNDDMS